MRHHPLFSLSLPLNPLAIFLRSTLPHLCKQLCLSRLHSPTPPCLRYDSLRASSKLCYLFIYLSIYLSPETPHCCRCCCWSIRKDQICMQTLLSPSCLGCSSCSARVREKSAFVVLHFIPFHLVWLCLVFQPEPCANRHVSQSASPKLRRGTMVCLSWSLLSLSFSFSFPFPFPFPLSSDERLR